MAEEFETIAYAILVVAFAVCCYLAGKGNLLEVVPEMLQERLKEITECGEWIENRCSLCSYETEVESIGFNCCGETRMRYKKHNYCPNCGARMNGERRKEDA